MIFGCQRVSTFNNFTQDALHVVSASPFRFSFFFFYLISFVLVLFSPAILYIFIGAMRGLNQLS